MEVKIQHNNLNLTYFLKKGDEIVLFCLKSTRARGFGKPCIPTGVLPPPPDQADIVECFSYFVRHCTIYWFYSLLSWTWWTAQNTIILCLGLKVQLYLKFTFTAPLHLQTVFEHNKALWWKMEEMWLLKITNWFLAAS